MNQYIGSSYQLDQCMAYLDIFKIRTFTIKQNQMCHMQANISYMDPMGILNTGL